MNVKCAFEGLCGKVRKSGGKVRMDCIISEQIPLGHPNELNIDMISRTKKTLPDMVEIQILSDSSACPRIIRRAPKMCVL